MIIELRDCTKKIPKGEKQYFMPSKEEKDTFLRICSDYMFGKRWESGMDFPGGASCKEPTRQCRRSKRCKFDPWIRKIPWRKAWQPTPVCLPGASHGQRQATVCRVTQSWTRLKQLSLCTCQRVVWVSVSVRISQGDKQKLSEQTSYNSISWWRL